MGGSATRVQARTPEHVRRLVDKTDIAVRAADCLAESLAADLLVPSAACEEVGLGFAKWCRGWFPVQVLTGDGAPVCARPKLLQNDCDDAVHAPDQNRFRWERELVDLRPDRGPLLGVGPLSIPAATGVFG